MTPRSATLLAGLLLALATTLLPLPDPSAALAVPQVAPAIAPAATCPAPEAAALPAVAAGDLLAPEPLAAACNQQECDLLCAPLQGRCKGGSCFCLRDPL